MMKLKINISSVYFSLSMAIYRAYNNFRNSVDYWYVSQSDLKQD